MDFRLGRRTTQLLFLILFVALLWLARREEGTASLLSSWLLRLDPLILLSVLMRAHFTALVLMWPAALLLLASIFLGRAFCGWVCPLGTCIDATDHLVWRQRERIRPRHAVKFYLLAALVVAGLFGLPLFWMLDPLPLLERALALFLHPLGLTLRDQLPLRLPDLAYRLRMEYPLNHPGFILGWLPGLLALLILALGYLSPRFWCRSLCPLGALLGMTGRFALWRRRVIEDCTYCSLCERKCKMGAIPAQDPERTLLGECILCYNCVACPAASTTIRFGGGRAGQAEATVDTSRRALLGALGIGAALGAASFVPRLRASHAESKLLRPPGANRRQSGGGLSRRTEAEFSELCIRCGACMRACPTAALQPATTQAGLDGVFTPVLIPVIGWCDQSCHACGDVCPTGALLPFRQEEKPHIVIGHAQVHRDRCLSWRRGADYRRCLICDEVCPYDAAQAHQLGGEMRPIVSQENCTGCGQCEHKCPARPFRAITVSRATKEA